MGLSEALATAQGEFTVPQKKKTATVKYKDSDRTFTYSYADLSDIRASITPALAKNGLAITQIIDAEPVRLTTMLLHKSGEFLAATYDLPKGLPAQQFGSALTYARRYSLCSLLGVVAEDDEDAQAAQELGERDAKNAKRNKGNPNNPTPIRPATTKGGTSGPKMEHSPKGLTLEDILTKIRGAYVGYMKLFPNEDLPGHVMQRYGATSVKNLNSDEAWDYLQWLDSEIKKGLGEAS